jgi:hypothetical protein
MYQRYYKQKRFGRFLGFALVIGSGLTHYVRNSYKFVKDNFKLETLSKLDIDLEFLMDKRRVVSSDIDFEKKYFIYENNLKNINNKTSPVFKTLRDDEQMIESYFKYKKFKNKFL